MERLDPAAVLGRAPALATDAGRIRHSLGRRCGLLDPDVHPPGVPELVVVGHAVAARRVEVAEAVTSRSSSITRSITLLRGCRTSARRGQRRASGSRTSRMRSGPHRGGAKATSSPSQGGAATPWAGCRRQASRRHSTRAAAFLAPGPLPSWSEIKRWKRPANVRDQRSDTRRSPEGSVITLRFAGATAAAGEAGPRLTFEKTAVSKAVLSWAETASPT